MTHIAILTAFIISVAFFGASYLPARPAVLGKTNKTAESSPKKTSSSREKQALRSRLRNIKQLPNGQTKAELYEKPVQFQADNGQWQDINTNLKTIVNGREVSATAVKKITDQTFYANENLIKSSFASSVASVLKMQFDGGTITNEYLGSTPSTAKLIGASDVLFENAYGNKVDIERKVLPGEIKQNIILKEKGHPRVFQEKIETTLRVELQKDNSIKYYNGDEVVAQTPPIYIVDMNGVRQDVALKYENKVLTITLPYKGLRRLTYPLVIDPSTTVYNTSNDDGYVSKFLDNYGSPSYAKYLVSASTIADGVNSECTAANTACNRAYLRFPLTGLGTITAATLKTYGFSGTSNGVLYHSAPYDLNVDSESVIWGKALDSSQVFSSVVNTVSSHTVTASVAADYNAGYQYTYFAILAGAAGNPVYTYGQDNSGTTYDPRLDVTYTSGSVPTAPTNPGGTAQSASTIRWTWTDASSDETGFRVHDSSHTLKCSAAAGAQTCDEGSLTANTSYTRHIHAYNASGESTATADVTKYTAAAAPNVTSDKTASTWYNTQTVTFTNAAGFGAGGVTKYKYVWDQTATHTFSGDGTDWSASTIPLSMTAGNTNYLHVQSYNGDTLAGSSANYGPFYYDAASPTGTTLSWGAIGTTTINLTAAGATDPLSGLRGDSLTYYIERDNGATSFVTADTNSGWVTGAWNQIGLSANTAYSYRVKARDNVGNESGWVNPTPAYAYTAAAAPNVTSDKTASTWYNTQTVTFTNAAGFGAGGVTKYKYVWDQTATHTFSGDGTDWSASTIPLSMTAGNTNYLHVQSYNGDTLAGSSANYGPFYYDAASPTGTTLSWGAIGTTTINLTAAGATDPLSGLRGDSLTYYIERDNGATSFVTADTNSGWVTGAWNQIGLSANTAYSYRVKARDNVGNESGWVNPTPAYAYTAANTPASASSLANAINPTTAIDVSWTAGAGGASRYHLRSSSDNYVALTDLDGSQTTFTESGLTPNTTYTYQIWAVSGDSIESASYATTNAITATGVPTNLNSAANSRSQITITWSAPPGGSDHYHLYRDSVQVGGHIVGTSYPDSGLEANTQYSYFVKAVNASEVEGVASASISRYTLAAIPNVTADKTVSTWYNTQALTFTNGAGFGDGGVAKYKYVWDQTATYTFSGDGFDWSASTQPLNMISGNSNYLHVQSYNGDNLAGSTAHYGPFFYDNTGPTGSISIDEGDYFKNGNADYTLHLTLSATDNQSGVAQMQFSKDGVVWCPAVSYSASASYILGVSPTCDPSDTLEGTKNIYVRYLDNLGNTGTIYSDSTMLDLTAPNNPSGVTGPGTSSSWMNSSTPQFTWTGTSDPGALDIPATGSGVSGYYVYFGSNVNGEPKTAMHAGNLAYVDNNNNNVYTTNTYTVSSDLVSGRTYYLKVRAIDNATNEASANYVENSNKFVYKFDNSNPNAPAYIEVSPPQPTTTDSFSFSWPVAGDNPTVPNSGICKYEYQRDNGTDTWTDSGLVTSVSNIHKYKAGANKFSVRVTDCADNVSQIVQATYYYSDPTAVTVQNLAVDDSLSQGGKINNFKFTWDGVPGVAKYYFASNTNPTENSSYITVDTLPMDTTISINSKSVHVVIDVDGNVELGPYASATQIGPNDFRVVAVDLAGSANWSGPATVGYSVDTNAPAAPSSLTITDASNRSASMYALTVMWPPVSNPNSDFDGYVVEKSTDGTIFNRVASVKTYIYSEAGLTEGQRYYYRIRSIDNTGNVSAGFAAGDRIPTGKYTVPPTITSSPAADVKATSVTITWNTNRSSNSIVQFGPGNGYGQEISSATNYVFDHSIDLNGLTPGVTYHYRVASIDKDYDYSEDSAFSQDYTFTTLQAPGISNVTTSEIRLYSAIVTWKTTSSATSRILYGTTTAYGKTYEDNSGSQTTTHTVKLNNLSESTTYHYKIQGLDVDGNILTSDDYVFETLTFPKISNLKLLQVPNTPTSTVKVEFDSNVPTSSMVSFNGNRGKEVAKYDLETSHVIQVTGLADNTAYSVTVKGRDQYGNETLPVSSSYKTDFDTRPPFITNITVETSIVGYGVDAKGQLVISWTTDEPSTSQVEYGTGVGGVEYSSRTQEDTSLTENHVVIISDLKPSSPYHFRVVSTDSAGNTGKSSDNSVLTEEASQSVIDLIIKSLQSSIGWIFSAFGGNK